MEIDMIDAETLSRRIKLLADGLELVSNLLKKLKADKADGTELAQLATNNSDFQQKATALLDVMVERITRLEDNNTELEREAQKLVQLLADVGDDTNWRDQEETDRVFAWYEFNGLRKALGQTWGQK